MKPAGEREMREEVKGRNEVGRKMKAREGNKCGAIKPANQRSVGRVGPITGHLIDCKTQKTKD